MGEAERNRGRFAWWLLFALGLLWTAWSSLVPVSSLPSVNVWDKAAHAINYGVLTWLLAHALPRPGPWVAAGWVVAYGILIEIAQWQSGYRTGDWQDALANGLGAGVAVLVLKLVHRLRQRGSSLG
ncbi:MAG: VanZ family protein [Gammaproteobacteria bacterium]